MNKIHTAAALYKAKFQRKFSVSMSLTFFIAIEIYIKAFLLLLSAGQCPNHCFVARIFERPHIDCQGHSTIRLQLQYTCLLQITAAIHRVFASSH